MRIYVRPGFVVLLAAASVFLAAFAQNPQPPDSKRAEQARTNAKAKTTTTAKVRTIPCKTPENAPSCYWTHGRLSIYEGMVNYRIWKVGTHRMLGVFSGPSHYPAATDEDMENPELPAELNRAYEADSRRLKKTTGFTWTIPPPVFADFEVCPLRSEEKGVRQPVCIESAKNIFVQDDD
jgi:hypothetical protein